MHLPRGARPPASAQAVPDGGVTVLVPGAMLAPAPTPQVVRAPHTPIAVVVSAKPNAKPVVVVAATTEPEPVDGHSDPTTDPAPDTTFPSPPLPPLGTRLRRHRSPRKPVASRPAARPPRAERLRLTLPQLT